LTYWMGIDGGGSTLRVAIVREDLQVIAQANGNTVSPSIIGRDAAANRIQTAVQAALAEAQLKLGDLSGVGAGIGRVFGVAPEIGVR